MQEVFISHIKEDDDIALELALELEKARFSTWCYELDFTPGPSYLENTRHAVEQASVMIVIISLRSLGSPQIERELVLGFQLSKRRIPILRDLSHAELQQRQPEWADLLGAATSINIPPGGVAALAPRVCEGLRRFGVPAVAPSPDRIEKIAAAARTKTDPRSETERPRPTARPQNEERAFKAPVATPEPAREPPHVRRPRGSRAWWSIAGLAAGVVLVATLAPRFIPHPGRASDPGPATPQPVVSDAITLGVMNIHSHGQVPDWMPDFTRDGLNTVLSKAPKVRVFSKQKIDFVREKRGLTEIEAAEQLGIEKMISGTLTASGGRFILEVEVVDIKTGLLEDSEKVEGREEQLVELQNRAVDRIVQSMKIALTTDDRNRMFARTNDSLDSYKLLEDTLTGGAEATKPEQPKEHQTSGAGWPSWGGVAYAAEATAEEAAVRKLLEQYRAALESKNLTQLAAVQEQMTDGQREALVRYFDNANELKVQFSNFDILVEGDEALATFTRNDVFKDVRSGRDMHLEVRMSSVLAKQAGEWKIRALKKPS